jgi:sugar lactone lactonase YvrE
MRKFLLVVGLFAAIAAYLLLLPTSVEPVAWSPLPSPSLEHGPYAVNNKLEGLKRIAQVDAVGPEGIVLDQQGTIYAGYLDGRIARFDMDGGAYQVIANTQGRPLGLALTSEGALVIADARKGLLLLQEGGQPQLLTNTAEGTPFGFTDDVAVEKSGRNIYFSDASTRFGFGEHIADLIEHGSTGRLLRYDPELKETTVLVKGLHFANGVAVGPDDAYVLVNETAEYRVVRYWLKGEKAGKTDVFVDNLPCFPDNVSFNGADRFWVACAAPRDPLLDKLAGQPFLRKIVARLPPSLQPAPKHHGMAFGFDLDGRLIANLQHEGGSAYSPTTSVREFGPYLYFGSLMEKAIGRLPLSVAIPGAARAPGGES